MTQVRYFGFVKAEEPWTGNQFNWYAYHFVSVDM